MVLPWGKYNVFTKDLDAENANWILLPIPREGSTAINTTAGDKLEAKEEGGGIVDAKYSKSTYEVVYDLFQKKGKVHPLAAKNVDGVIVGNYALAIQPAEDTAVQGIYVGKSTISSTENLSSTDGGYTSYTHSCAIPEGDSNAALTIDGITHYRSICWKKITATPVTGQDGQYTLAFADPS